MKQPTTSENTQNKNKVSTLIDTIMLLTESEVTELTGLVAQLTHRQQPVLHQDQNRQDF